MNDITNKTNLFKKNLFSGDTSLVLDTISDIRKNGSITVIPLLLDLYIVNQNSIIQQAIKACLFDLKTPQVAPIIIEALSEKKYNRIKPFLIEVMWQANIDFSEYANIIVSLVYSDSFESAIEAMTVLDTISESITNNDKIVFKKELSNAAQDKQSPHKDIIYQAIEILN
ncbi:MAG: hypothetical protein R6U95_03660 [Bacteroidales bacterium]